MIQVVAPASLLLLFSSAVPAQNSSTPQPDSIPVPQQAVAAQSPSPAPPPVSLSGVLYLNYQYGGPRNTKSENRFDMDRAYLNFRAASGSRDSIRVTLDVFQQRDATRDQYYRGWTMRVKYAYLNHELVRGSGDALKVFARLGLIQTVMIEKEEQFWNRGLSQVAAEQAGYFNSADAGAAVGVTLPNRAGEIYTTIMNGSGYASRETDRYKDFQTRLTLTPWASGSGPLKGLQLSPWFSIGGRSSDFLAGQGMLQPVVAARRKHRFGFLATYRDARLVLGAHLARRLEVAETADTTVATAPTTRDVTGHLTSVFGFFRPLATTTATAPWSLLFRVDDIKPDDISPGTQRRYIVGTAWDLSTRTSLTFDVQSLSPRNGLSGTPARTFFLHIISNF